MASLSDSIIRQALSDNSGQQLVMQEIRRVQAIETKKQDLLGDPKKLDELTSAIAQQFSPVTLKPKNLSKYSSKTEAIDSSVPEDHPFYGMGVEVRNRLQQALKDPQYRGQSISAITQAVVNNYVMEPDKTGSPRLEKAFKYKRERDAELKLGLNPFGEDTSIRKLPGYDQWHEEVRKAEDQNLASKSYFASWDDLRDAALWGGGIGAAIGTVTGGPIGAAVEGGIAAAASPILEAIAHPVRRAIEGSEWFRSKIASDSTYEGLKAEAFKIGTDIGIGFAGWGAGSRVLRRGMRAAAEAGKLTEESVSRFLKSGKALDAVKAGEASFAAKKAAQKFENELENVARDDIYESASDVIDSIRKARGQEKADIALGDISKRTEEALGRKRKDFVSVLDEIKKQREARQLPVKTNVIYGEAPKPEVPPVSIDPKKQFSELTQQGAEKAINEGAVSGDLNGAISKVHQEEEVVRNVVKKEANDYIELLTGKQDAGKKIHATDKARAVLQSAGYDIEEIGSLSRRKLLRLAGEASREKKVTVVKEVVKTIEEETKIPGLLKPEAQGITVPAEEAVAQSDREISNLVSDSETTGYLAGMLESGKLKAEELMHEGPVTSSRAIDLPPVAAEERAVPQEALIDDFIYDKLDEQFAKKYGDQFGYWLAKEHYPDVKPNAGIQSEIQKQYEFLQKKYGYDLKAMVPSKQKAILKYADREGYEQIEFDKDVKKIRSLFDGKKLLGTLGVAIVGALTVPLLGFLSPDEAQAAGFDTVGRAIPRVLKGLVEKAAGASSEAKVALMSGIREAGYLPGEILEGQKTVPMEYFGRQIHIAEQAKEAGIKASEMVARTKGLPLGFQNMMSPTGAANLFYKTGYSVAVQRAHLQTLWAVHTRDVIRVVDNILKDVPGLKPSSNEIAKITAPFVKEYGVVQATRAMEARLEQTERAIESLYKKSIAKGVGPKTLDALDKSINKAELGRDLLKKEIDRLTPQVDSFNSRFEDVEKQIAQKFPSARVFYAAEDTADFVKRPWLKGLVTYEEEVAAGHIKDLMETYALRMLEGHHKVITDSPYMYHAFHPKYSADKAKEFLDEIGVNINPDAAFIKFFKRSKYSKAFIPDVNYALNKYIPDSERRILTSDFWRKSGPKAYRQSGWYSHMRTPTVQFNPVLSSFWNRMWTADEPEMRTVGNRLANWYTAFETAALIGFSPATAFKHIFKNEGTWGQLGLSASLSHIPEAIGTASRNWLHSGQVQDGIVMSSLRKLGVDTSVDRRVLDKFGDAVTHQYRMMHHMSDMHLPGIEPGVANSIDKFLFKVNQKGSTLISGIEAFDRAHSFHASLDMAVNKGLTEKQALYGIFDTILKNNFLGGGLNPNWMRKPGIRALFLFQNTPFKILERRLVNGIQTYSNVKTAIGVVRKQDLQKTLVELRDLGRYIRKGSDELKSNLIGDALFSNKDVFGTPVTTQFMREFMYVGATIFGLGSLFNADFVPHTFHVPFISTFGGDKPQLGVSPLVNAVYKGLTRKRNSTDETGQEVGWVSQFFQDWLGRKQFIPQTFYKLNRISENDIPEIYKDSKFRYLFALPTRE